LVSANSFCFSRTSWVLALVANERNS
jgi:hypothetical protein